MILNHEVMEKAQTHVIFNIFFFKGDDMKEGDEEDEEELNG